MQTMSPQKLTVANGCCFHYFYKFLIPQGSAFQRIFVSFFNVVWTILIFCFFHNGLLSDSGEWKHLQVWALTFQKRQLIAIGSSSLASWELALRQTPVPFKAYLKEIIQFKRMVPEANSFLRERFRMNRYKYFSLGIKRRVKSVMFFLNLLQR